MKIFTVFNHNFAKYYRLLKRSCNRLNYTLDYKLLNESLNDYYYLQLEDGWKSKALHKAKYLLQYMEELPDGELVIYLDVDTLLLDKIDEVNTKDYDIGLTYRIKEDFINLKNGHEKYMEIGNCGVLFLYKNEQIMHLLKTWGENIYIYKNDQLALKATLDRKTIKTKDFDPIVYNFAYFKHLDYRSAKILHFKTSSRQYYKNFIL